MNYQEMSDFEINCEVARRLGMSYAFWFSKSEEDFCEEIKPNQRGPIWHTGEFLVCGYRPSNGHVFNPCNSWADAAPIVEENLISFDQHYNGSYAKVWGYSDKGLHEVSVLRSDIKKGICIVFLMMKGG